MSLPILSFPEVFANWFLYHYISNSVYVFSSESVCMTKDLDEPIIRVTTDIFLERLQYHLSTNLGLLQANLTYVHAKFGTSYHWIPELYRRLKLLVFDGVQEVLEKHSVQRKRILDRKKMTPVKKRRIALKVQRTLERIKWSKKHGHDTYGCDSASDSENELGAERKMKKQVKGRVGKCTSCGSSSHQRSSHSECPFNKACSGAERSTNSDPVLSECDEAIAQSVVTSATLSDVCNSDIGSDLCTCGAEGRAHRRDCPMRSRKRPFPASIVQRAVLL